MAVAEDQLPIIGEMPWNPQADAVMRGLWWRKRQRASTWVEEKIVLPPSITAYPGPFDIDITPYAQGILDAMSDPRISTIVLKTGTQTIKTTILLLFFLYALKNSPGPGLFVAPTETLAKEILTKRLLEIAKASPALRDELPRTKQDSTKDHIYFKSMAVNCAWATSPSSLSSRPIRYLALDEVNKYPPYSGKEAAPIELAEERLKTYKGLSKQLIASTPTVRGGYIDVAYQATDQRKFYVPCPFCGFYQVLYQANVHCPKKEEFGEMSTLQMASKIRMEGLAWYTCTKCRGSIRDAQKRDMVRKGVWCPEGGQVSPEGVALFQGHLSDSVGFWVNALYCTWVSFSDAQAKLITSKDSVHQLQNYVNSWNAEEFERELQRVEIQTRNLSNAKYQLKRPPEDTLFIVVGTDMQIDHLWYVVRAYMKGGGTCLVEEGRLMHRMDDDGHLLHDEEGNPLTDLRQFEEEVVMGTWRTLGKEPRDLQARLIAIDSRYRTSEVYALCRKHMKRVIPIKGSGTQMWQPYTVRAVGYMNKHGQQVKDPKGLKYYQLDTGYFKDTFAEHCQRGDWYLPLETSGTYHRHITSEHKVIEKDPDTGIETQKWVMKKGWNDNHLKDSEVYAIAAAEILGFYASLSNPRTGTSKKAQTRKRSGRTAKIRTHY